MSRVMPIEEVHFRLHDALARRKLSGWELGFTKSFVRLCNRGGSPSVKQEICARRIVAEIRAPEPGTDDPLIEMEGFETANAPL
jgi:hypothetical protein